ncbi:MAG: LysR family transcriptional regulator [Eggerthellaceae bacterium]|nr:LysR family transcriptional regulator [Eggerthellaceae bacterium]
MEISYLEEFVALAHRLNFTKTADELHLAQSTLSKHMSLLEADLSVRLFRRHHSQVELTEEGYFFLGVASGIVNDYKSAQNTVRTMAARKPISIEARMEDPAISGLISIASSLTSENSVQITFNHMKDRAPLELISSGELDLLIDMLPARDGSMPDSIATRFLFSRPFVAVMEPDNPLAQKSSLTIADLKDSLLAQLIWDHTKAGWEKITELCRQNGFEPRVRPLAVRSQAEAIAVLPTGSILLYPGASKELKFLDYATNRIALPITDERAVFSTYAIYRQDNWEKLRPFIEQLEQAVKNLGL